MRYGSPEFKLYTDLMTYAYSRAHSPQDAEDAASEAYCECHKRKLFDAEGFTFGAKCIRNILYDILKRRKREIIFDHDGEPIPIGVLYSDDEPQLRARRRRRLLTIIHESELPKKHEKVLEYRLDGWSISEIAERMKVPERTIRLWRRQAIDAIKLRNPEFEDAFYEMSRVHLKNSVTSLTSLMALHLHRNPRAL